MNAELTTSPVPTSQRLYTMSIGYSSFMADAAGEGVVDTWTNTLGYPIFIVGADIWIGEQGRANTDTPFQLTNATNSDVLVSAGWDHYAEPTGINDNEFSRFWGPCYYLCMPGDVINFKVRSVAYNATPQSIGAGALIRYMR